MVEHDLELTRQAQGDSMVRVRTQAGRYSRQQAFFYQAEWWLDVRPLVSEAAYAYARQMRWADPNCIWSLRRSDVRRVDGKAISECGLIYEHVYTGWMFGRDLGLLWERSRNGLDADAVAELLSTNYQTAWITREEDKLLPRSERGKSLKDALGFYQENGITLLPRPTRPEADRASSLHALDRNEIGQAPKDKLSQVYDRFYEALHKGLRKVAPDVALNHSAGRHYAMLKTPASRERGIDLYGELRGPADGRSFYLTIQQPVDRPLTEPTGAGWAELHARLGDGGAISFGHHSRKPDRLCRYRIPVGGLFRATTREATRAGKAAAEALADHDAIG